MDAMRSSWTDERLDYLNHRVDSGFNRVDGEIKGLRAEMNVRFDSMEGHFQALNRTLIRCGFGLATSFVGLIITFVLTNH